MKMVLENTNYNEVIHNKLKKCEFCGKELEPIGFDYLYVNISPDCIEYQRCNCSQAQKYWREKDKQEYEKQKRTNLKVCNRLHVTDNVI